MTQNPSALFEAIYDAGTTGLAGNLAVAIQDNQNNVVYGPTTLEIVELLIGGLPTGMYRAMLTAPAAEGQYSIIWSNDGSFDPQNGGAEEDLLVQNVALSLPALGDALEDSLLCSAWTTESDVINMCSGDDLVIGTSDPLLDQAIVASSELLYDASGRRYPGDCSTTRRPCGLSCMYGFQVLSRGHLVGWDWNHGAWGDWSNSCGCRPISRVLLPGDNVVVTSVLIDGVVLDPATYFVSKKRWLVRKDGALWPRCQMMDRDESETGTFAVDYTYGKAPPVAGQLAAQQLACEVFKGLRGLECALPTGVTRVTRQGVSIERTFLQRGPDGVWQSGLGLVDMFLNSVNPKGIPRRATFWSPSRAHRFAEPNPE